MAEEVRREMIEHMDRSIDVLKSNLAKVQTGRANPAMKTQMEAVEKGILAADLGLNPANDGHVIRVKVPKLSEERRNELTKVIKSRGEEAKVALRNIRREANDKLEQLKKDGAISEDEYHRHHKQNDETIHEYTQTVDQLVEEKGKQIQTI